MAVTNDDLLQRLTLVEERQRVAADQASLDRAGVKRELVDMKTELSSVKTSVAEINGNINNAIQRFEGGRAVLRALWWLGGLGTGGAALWATGWLKPLVAVFGK